jgi:uncharacterized peroxidase-related enzyme
MFRPEVAQPISLLADVLLHAENSLSRGERELIAAYVSSLNDSEFCHNSHAAVASCHLADEGATVAAVASDAHSAPVSSKMKALLAIAARVQRSGRDVREQDITRARTEGATDVEIHDTVLIAAAFCMLKPLRRRPRRADALRSGRLPRARAIRRRPRLRRHPAPAVDAIVKRIGIDSSTRIRLGRVVRRYRRPFDPPVRSHGSAGGDLQPSIPAF